MDDYIKRMGEEIEQLSERLQKLTAFINSEKFGPLDGPTQILMREQSMHMTNYLSTLTKRYVRSVADLYSTKAAR